MAAQRGEVGIQAELPTESCADLSAPDVGVRLVTMTDHSHTFTVVLEPAEEGGFIVTVPALPELGTQGDTYDEAMANAREALELVIEDRLSRGEPIPPDIQPQIERITIAA
jgi:antitoxin HicB